MLTNKEKEWYKDFGTPQEQAFVRKYGNTRFTVGGFLRSLAWLLLLLFCMMVVPLVGCNYVSNLLTMRRVTGAWVGTLQTGEGAAYRCAVYIRTSVNPLSNPLDFGTRLTGSVRMCDNHGYLSYHFKTRSAGSDILGLELFASDDKESGRLFATLQDQQLRATYNGTEPGLSGELQRGSTKDFENACATLRMK